MQGIQPNRKENEIIKNMLFNLRENKKGMKRNIEYMGKIENKL